MKKWTQDKFNEAVRLHGLWLVDDEKGKRADMRGADMRDADMRGADMRGADMQDADMRGANMQGADMRGADMRDADMRGANIQGANMRGADMAQARGVKRCSVDWDGHGECGRKLTAVRIGKEDRYFCACFEGTLEELREYIANGAECNKASRTKVADFVASCMADVTT